MEQLIAEGKAYRAYDTPEDLARMRENQQKRGLPPGYDRRHRHLNEAERAEYEKTRGQFAAVRFAVPLEGKTTFTDAVYGEITVENRLLEDAILLKSDGYPTYHLAAQVDDHLMEISHVLRGEEWLPSRPDAHSHTPRSGLGAADLRPSARDDGAGQEKVRQAQRCIGSIGISQSRAICARQP